MILWEGSLKGLVFLLLLYTLAPLSLQYIYPTSIHKTLKAIYLRYLAKRKAATAHQIDHVILELEQGQQLEVQDIEKALHHETMNTRPLYAPQLYFGPGFENRLELEFSYITDKQTDDCLSDQEEMKIRLREDDLFAKIAAPPKLLEGVFDVLTATEDEYKTDNDVEWNASCS